MSKKKKKKKKEVKISKKRLTNHQLEGFGRLLIVPVYILLATCSVDALLHRLIHDLYSAEVITLCKLYKSPGTMATIHASTSSCVSN